MAFTPRSVYVRVITWNLESDAEDPENERVINYSLRAERDWLGKHSFWCFNNHRSVETMNDTDAPPAPDAQQFGAH